MSDIIKVGGAVIKSEKGRNHVLGYTIDTLHIRTVEGVNKAGSLVVNGSILAHSGSVNLTNYRIDRYEYVVNDRGNLNLAIFAVRVKE